jgi:hypothetical protein
MNGRLYIHKNKINGKCYVGQTTKKYPKKRWAGKEKAYNHCSKFYNAIKLYGWDNFEHIILPTIYTTMDELNNAEIELIKELKSIEYGYNTNIGGDNKLQTQETKDLIALKNSIPISQYDVDGNFIQKWQSKSEAQRKLKITNISQACKNNVTQAGNFVWKYYENNDENITYKPSKINLIRKEVNQYDLDGNFIKTYKTLYEAQRETNVTNQNIHKVCNGSRKTAGGYKWRYL